MAPVGNGKKSIWSLQFESAQDARKAAVDSAKGFYVIAAIQAAAAFLLGASMLVDAVLFASLGAWLHLAKSRIAASLLLVLGAITVATTLTNQLGDGQGGGKNVALAVIVAWAAVRAAIATYKLPGLAKLEVQRNGSAALP